MEPLGAGGVPPTVGLFGLRLTFFYMDQDHRSGHAALNRPPHYLPSLERIVASNFQASLKFVLQSEVAMTTIRQITAAELHAASHNGNKDL
jgi:hypothetical protein